MVSDNFLEDIFWTSYRYCIGRHSYVTSYAADMAEYFYNKLSNEKKEHYALDIRMQIEEQLHMYPFNFHYDWSIKRNERKPLEDFLEFINNQKFTNGKELTFIRNIEVFKKDNKIQYSIAKTDKLVYEHSIYEYDILDLLPWADLASLFDVKDHKMVTLRSSSSNKDEQIECYESYMNNSEVISTEGNYTTLKAIPWQYKKVYRPVKYGISGRFCDEQSIIKIEDML
jgi:hypothetical protein